MSAFRLLFRSSNDDISRFATSLKAMSDFISRIMQAYGYRNPAEIVVIVLLATSTEGTFVLNAK